MITKLHPTDLIAAEVPIYATEVQVWNHGIGFKAKSIKRLPDDTNGFFHLHTGLCRWRGYEIIGEINKDKISVDYNKFPQVSLTIQESRLLLDHNDNIDLRKLLKENGLYFEAQEKLIKGKLIILKKIK